jgi:hypothetical protein
MDLDVVGRGRHIGHDQYGGDDADGEGAEDDVDQVKGTGCSCQLTRRSTRDEIHQ